MTISESGQRLIEDSEGLELKAYRDVAGVLTIGYGHTDSDVYDGLTWTPEQAANALLNDLHNAEETVNRVVRVPMTQGQFDALVDFVYNLGPERLLDSTLLREFNMGNTQGAAAQFGVWVMAGGKVQPGLVKRRAAEKAMFLS